MVQLRGSSNTCRVRNSYHVCCHVRWHLACGAVVCPPRYPTFMACRCLVYGLSTCVNRGKSRPDVVQ